MKLRINKNSIRLRLSQSEVDEFKKNGYVQETVALSGLAFQKLAYSLIQTENESISVSFLNNHLRLYIPSNQANQWCDSNEVGFDYNLVFDQNNTLYVLVEKDFKCLQPRSNEDETDNFPNPNSAVC